MKGLHFESRGEGNYYKLILHIGSSYVPISDEIIETLKQHMEEPPNQFLSIFLEQVGYSSYLKENIQTELTNAGDVDTQVAAIQRFLKGI